MWEGKAHLCFDHNAWFLLLPFPLIQKSNFFSRKPFLKWKCSGKKSDILHLHWNQLFWWILESDIVNIFLSKSESGSNNLIILKSSDCCALSPQFLGGTVLSEKHKGFILPCTRILLFLVILNKSISNEHLMYLQKSEMSFYHTWAHQKDKEFVTAENTSIKKGIPSKELSVVFQKKHGVN